jgi:phosphopantothenoylcysteine synthetase/decarboxylase
VLGEGARITTDEAVCSTGAMTPPLGFVICGAPLAERSAEVARSLVEAGYELSVGVTASATEWIDPQQLTNVVGQPVSTRLRRPTEQRRTPRPGGVVAFPLTFNTASKIAHGIMDNHVTGTLCDALAIGAPIVATLMVSDRLWGHPAWPATISILQAAGVRFLDPRGGHLGRPEPVPSGTGEAVAEQFDPSWVVEAVRSLPRAS